MEDSIKNIITALLADDDSALKELFRAQVEDTVNQFLQNEMTAVLGYEPYARTGRDGQRNYRNGYYNRAFDSTLGNLTVKTPRNRMGLFKNALFEPYARHTSTLEETIIMMYSKGITTREIAEPALDLPAAKTRLTQCFRKQASSYAGEDPFLHKIIDTPKTYHCSSA